MKCKFCGKEFNRKACVLIDVELDVCGECVVNRDYKEGDTCHNCNTGKLEKTLSHPEIPDDNYYHLICGHCCSTYALGDQ